MMENLLKETRAKQWKSMDDKKEQTRLTKKRKKHLANSYTTKDLKKLINLTKTNSITMYLEKLNKKTKEYQWSISHYAKIFVKQVHRKSN